MYKNEYLDGELIDDCRDYYDDDFDYDKKIEKHLNIKAKKIKVHITSNMISAVIMGSSFMIHSHPIIKGTILFFSGLSIYIHTVEGLKETKKYIKTKKHHEMFF